MTAIGDVFNRSLQHVILLKKNEVLRIQHRARIYYTQAQKQVSHETLYRSLYVQARGVLKKALIQYLKTQRVRRRSKHSSLKDSGLGQIKDTVSISERPPSIEDRAIPGHWEGDLIAGSKNSDVVTLVEQHSHSLISGQCTDPASQGLA